MESQRDDGPGESPELGALAPGLCSDSSRLSPQLPVYTSPPAHFSCKAMSGGRDHSGECFHEISWLRDTGKSLTPPPQLGLQHPASELAVPSPSRGGTKSQGFAGSQAPQPTHAGRVPMASEPQRAQLYLGSSAGVGTPLSPSFGDPCSFLPQLTPDDLYLTWKYILLPA